VRQNKPARQIRRAALAVLILAAAPAIGAESEAPKKSLEEVERELNAARDYERRIAAEAEAQIRVIETLRAQMSTVALATQENEANLSAIEARLAGLDAEEAVKSAELERRRGEMVLLLGALQRLARHPPEALVLLPTPPIDTLRTTRLLGTVVPQIEKMAKELVREVDDLRGLRETMLAEREALADATKDLSANRERLRALVARRTLLYRDTETAYNEATDQVESLARQAADLRDLLRRLDESKAASRRPPPSVQSRVTEGLAGRVRRLGEARGQMAFPARGQIVLGFGQPGEGGQPHRGLSIETRPEAQIVAPFDGQIVFAGPFRGYGHILIIQHGEGYHTLLAGLGRIDVSVGQVVATGEPVAASGNGGADSPADIGNRGAGGGILYVELRRHGQPINPLPWLAASNGKVSG
jgi:septal ring factor EnvC (AmiA/AmiB activator)